MGDGRPSRRMAPSLFLKSLTLLLLACALPAWAAEGRDEAMEREGPQGKDEPIAWKFTPTYYHTSNQPSAWDLNLRGSLGPQNAWVGFYRQQEEFQQLRLGYDYTAEVAFGRVVPSIQYATRGFWGGSVTAEIGDRNFGLLGWGRTNLKEYFNLNFDPNDAVTFGVGTRMLPKTTLTLFQVRDDRLDTGQRVTHLVARVKPDDNTRWTVDIFYKEGRPDSDPASAKLHGTGVTLTYDFGRYFARVASDPHVNFTDSHMTRVAFGWRF